MNNTDDDDPVLVFEGPYEEVLFLKTLIESAGLGTSFDGVPHRGYVEQSRLFVRRADAEHAGDLVADFRRHGRRSSIL